MTTSKFEELLSQIVTHIVTHCNHNLTNNYSRYYKYNSNCLPRGSEENSLNLISNQNNIEKHKT